MKTIINVTGFLAKPVVTSNRNDVEVFFLDYKEIEKNEAIHSLSICGTCGTRDQDRHTAFCENDHDNWVEVRDFFDPELEEHINNACTNLGLNRDELITGIIWGL